MARKGKALGVVALLAFSAVLAWPTGGQAQERVSVEGRGGISLPAGRLADVVDAGPSVGLQIGYKLGPRVRLNVDGNLDVLDGATFTGGATAPDMRLWSWGGGVEFSLLSPAQKRWMLLTSLGLGGTTFRSDSFEPGGGEPTEFNHTYFSSNGGARIGYALSPRVTTFVGARAMWASTNREDTGALVAIDPTSLRPFSAAWTFPLTLGVNLKT